LGEKSSEGELNGRLSIPAERARVEQLERNIERIDAWWWVLNPAAILFPPIVQVWEADRMAQKHKGKIALITGANKGIGFEVARQLGTEGITVLVGARDPQLGEGAAAKLKTEGVDAHFIELDVTKPESIAKAAEQIRGQYDRLDILVNNAGVVAKGDGPPSVADPDAVRRVLDVNFFGVLAVTQAMLPLVRKAASGRIVMVSSGLGSLTWNADPNWSFAAIKPLGYNGSKAILNMMTVQLAWELRDTPIKVNTVNPGYTATDLNGNSGTQTIEEGAAETVRQSLVPDDAPTGGFFETGGVVPW
jgi:NAD(P)-dependent dehydrogenase (short-subunit alcohol dehydrogenase family)